MQIDKFEINDPIVEYDGLLLNRFIVVKVQDDGKVYVKRHHSDETLILNNATPIYKDFHDDEEENENEHNVIITIKTKTKPVVVKKKRKRRIKNSVKALRFNI